MNNKLMVSKVIDSKANAYGITIHGCEIMRDHIHLFLSFKTRHAIQSFMKVTAGLIARLITKARKGKPFGQRFWDGLAYTRIVTGARDFATMRNYLAKNKIEREDGTLHRRAEEFHEKVERDAKTRKISYEDSLRLNLDKL